MLPPLRFRDVRLSTGVRLHVAESGPAGADETLLFLHGYSDSWFSFSRILPLLPSTVHAIALTQRGHGDSERPAGGYAMADFAADAVALLDALGVRRATVVGHSMGSIVARRVAAEYPERVERLVLVDSCASPVNEGTAAMQVEVEAMADPVPEPYVRAFQESTVHAEVPGPFMDAVVAESLKLPARVWRAALAGLLADDGSDTLPRIGCPTLVLWGAHDAVFSRADQDRLLAALPEATLRVYPDVGHTPHWERPERFVEDLMAFVAAAAVPVG
jgi:non-heme chloroperoxidase